MTHARKILIEKESYANALLDISRVKKFAKNALIIVKLAKQQILVKYV